MAQFIGWYDNALAPGICRDIYRHRGSAPVSGQKYVCATFIHPRF